MIGIIPMHHAHAIAHCQALQPDAVLVWMAHLKES